MKQNEIDLITYPPRWEEKCKIAQFPLIKNKTIENNINFSYTQSNESNFLQIWNEI